MTHREYLDARKAQGQVPSVLCTAANMTFQGRCLNCGWNENDKTQGQTAIDRHLEKFDVPQV